MSASIYVLVFSKGLAYDLRVPRPGLSGSKTSNTISHAVSVGLAVDRANAFQFHPRTRGVLGGACHRHVELQRQPGKDQH